MSAAAAAAVSAKIPADREVAGIIFHIFVYFPFFSDLVLSIVFYCLFSTSFWFSVFSCLFSIFF